MRLKITHQTSYTYDAPVKYGLQQIRLTPLSDTLQTVHKWDVAIEGGHTPSCRSLISSRTTTGKGIRKLSSLAKGENSLASLHALSHEILDKVPYLVGTTVTNTTAEEAIKLLTVSFDSTVKANLSVGLPLDYQIYATDGLKVTHANRIEVDDPYFLSVSKGWDDALRTALDQLPKFDFE